MRDTVGVKLLLIAEGDRFKCKDGLAHVIHGLDLVLEALAGRCRAELAAAIDHNGRSGD